MIPTLPAAALTAGVLSAHAAWNLRHLRTPPAPTGSARPTRQVPPAPVEVSVLVPARNEAGRIGPCLRAVLAGLDGLAAEVLVLDDRSTDGTAELARDAGGDDPRLRVLDGRPLPPGWLGKPHACQQLGEAAQGAVLVFLDADVLVAPDGLARSVALLREARLELVSPYPRQEAEGLLPRLVQPLLQWSWLTFLPLRRAERSPRPSLTAANGQLLACEAGAYQAVGGHVAVRAEVVEDVALARAFKRAGFRAAVADGTQVASCRMYADGSELAEGYAKSLAAAFGSPLGAAAVMGLLLWVYALPPVALVGGLLRGRPRTAAVGLLGYGAAVGGRVVAARRFRGRVADAPAHPVSIACLAWLTARSWQRRRSGTATWKGRVVG